MQNQLKKEIFPRYTTTTSDMNILIVYASNSGSTFQVAEIIEFELAKKHHVVVQTAAQTLAEELHKYDLVILGSPSWSVEGNEGYPAEPMLALLRGAMNTKFVHKKFALFGCGDTSYTYFCGAVDWLEKFVDDVRGDRVVESLRVDGFYFDLKNAKRKAGEWARTLRKVLNN